MGKKKQNKVPYGMRSRRDWGELNPVERVVKNKKKYNRKNQKRKDRREYSSENRGCVAYCFEEEVKTASIRKIKLFGHPTLNNCSCWYIPKKNLLLYFNSMGHNEFVGKFFSKEPYSSGNKVVDEVISEARDELNIDNGSIEIGYGSFLGLGWIRIFALSSSPLFVKSEKKNFKNIINVLSVFMDKIMSDGVELYISHKRVKFNAGSFPNLKDIAIGLRNGSISEKISKEIVSKKRFSSVVNRLYIAERMAEKI